MPFNGSGVHSLPEPASSPVVGAVIDPALYRSVLVDLSEALSATLLRDGRAAMAGDLNLGGNDIVNGVFKGTGVEMPISAVAQFDQGSPAVPALTFRGDLDTGFYQPSANQVGITVAGAYAMRWEAGAVHGNGSINMSNSTGPAEYYALGQGVGEARFGAELTGGYMRVESGNLKLQVIDGATTRSILTGLPDGTVAIGAEATAGYQLSVSKPVGASARVISSVSGPATFEVTSGAALGTLSAETTTVSFYSSGALMWQTRANEGLRLGSNNLGPSSQYGHVAIPSVAGAMAIAPVGTYTDTGHAPLVYDGTNKRLRVWDSATSSWLSVLLA